MKLFPRFSLSRLVPAAALLCSASALAWGPAVGTVTEYPLAASQNGSGPYGVVVGRGGHIWFTEQNTNQIGRLNRYGAHEADFNIPTANANPTGICQAADGSIWFTEEGAGQVAKITFDGTITEYPLPGGAAGVPIGIAAGSDGNLYVAELIGNTIDKVTPAGVVTATALPPNALPVFVAAAAGSVWFTEQGTNQIGNLTTAGVLTQYAGAGAPQGIAVGSDGNIWYTQLTGSAVSKLVPATGVSTTYAVPGSIDSPNLPQIVSALDGNLWFIDVANNQVDRLTTAGVLTQYNVTTAGASLSGIAAGPDTNECREQPYVWVTENAVTQLARVYTGEKN